jgi:hypothetical protein
VLRGSQDARYNTAPSPRGYSSRHAELALEFAAGYGLHADPWQEAVVHAWLRKDKHDMWCSSTWGVSAPRQNGKNGGLEVVELYGMVALGLKFLHTSHLLPSARKAFKRLQHFFGNKAEDPQAKFPELNALVKEIRKTNGQEMIELHNGGLIELGARTSGAGRGSSFDVLVVDEAQEYEEDEQEALEATVSASPSGDPVIIYMGTPPANLSERGAPFVRVRNAAVSGEDKRSAWVEHSADGDVDAMDEAELRAFTANRRHWAAANPALGRRITERTVEGEHFRFSPRSFARERLNMWPKPTKNQAAIPTEQWNELGLDEVPEDWPLVALGMDMNPERTKVTIGVAAKSPDGIHLEVAEDTPFTESGTDALVNWVFERAGRRIPIVMDAYSPLRSIEAALKAKKCKVFILGPHELSQACGGLYDAVVKDKTVSHYKQDSLNVSLAGAVKQKFGEGGAWKWNRKGFEIDLTQIMSITCAHFGAVKFAKSHSSSGSKAKVVVLGD